MRINYLYRGLAWLTLFAICASPAVACTTAVISGRVTADGRPILWKNRDYASAPRNEVVIFADGKYRSIAVVNAGSRSAVWMGANSAGFCIENSLSTDLAEQDASKGPGNGAFMKLALATCSTVEEFRTLLESTNETGRQTVANFGVIDAAGGAALFETGPKDFAMFDANDPVVAPQGYIVRSNFALTAHDLPANPAEDQLGKIASAGRYLRACGLLEARGKEPFDVEYVLRRLARDLSDESGEAIPGSVNAPEGQLPDEIPTANTISRASTVSAAVFHGVKPGEDPRLTTMWTVLGDPKFSVAVPCWPILDSIADPLADERGGEIGEIARSLRDWSLALNRDAVYTAGLPGIWSDLWPLESAWIGEVAQLQAAWHNEAFDGAKLTAVHHDIAARAMVAMQLELRQAKEASLRGDYAKSSLVKPLIRVAIYDHSDGSANGPKNLMRFLSLEHGFESHRVRPEDIRAGALDQFDVLIMPGGSGSAQAEKLEESGRDKVRSFVDHGGGYVGICAGSYLASSHYTWSLNLINARVWDRAHWARGTGTVRLGLSDQGRRVLQHDSTEVDVYYGQGPLLIPGNNTALPPYEVLAVYETEIASKGAPQEAMVGTHAIVRSSFGTGRVICFSPHPETTTGPNHLMSSGVKWAAKRD